MRKFKQHFTERKSAVERFLKNMVTRAFENDEYTKMFAVNLNREYLKQSEDDGQLILKASREYYVKSHTQLFTKDKQGVKSPMLVYIDEYHKHTGEQLKLATEQICYAAHTKVAAIVKVEKQNHFFFRFAKIKEALFKLLTKHRIWKSMYPTLRIIVAGFELHMDTVVHIGLNFGAKVAYLVPYNFDIFILTDMTNFLYEGTVEKMNSEMENRWKSFVENDVKPQYNIIVDEYQKIRIEINGNKNSVLENPFSLASATKSSDTEKSPAVYDTLRNSELKNIIADIKKEFKKLKYGRDVGLTLEMRMVIQSGFDKFALEVNRINAKWMQKVYVNMREMKKSRN